MNQVQIAQTSNKDLKIINAGVESGAFNNLQLNQYASNHNFHQPEMLMSAMMMANGRFMITKSIGKGSFGEIFQGLDTQTNKEVAIKMEHKHCKVKVLAGEAKILKQLQGIEGFPKMYWFGQEHNQNILVMELLGPSLSQLYKQNGQRFSMLTVLKLIDQILQRLESMHNTGFIHRDIKPNNFVMGLPGTPNQNMLYLIDFGLSKPYKDIKRGVHFPQLPPGRSLTGTARYASINSHQGFTLSRRDDLESIAYMIIQFLRGNLPWQGIGGANKLEKYSNILELKMQTVEEILCKDIPEQFCKFLKYAKELEYDEKPDYKRFRHEFRVLFIDLFHQIPHNIGVTVNEQNFKYDWQMKKKSKLSSIKQSNLISPALVEKEEAKNKSLQKEIKHDNILHVEPQLGLLKPMKINSEIAIANANHQGPVEDSKYQSVRESEAEGEEELKIPLLFNNFEGLREDNEEESMQVVQIPVQPVQNHQQSTFKQINQGKAITSNSGQMTLNIENDPYYIQKQVGDDPCCNKARSFDTSTSSFILNPNKRVTKRQITLNTKQEQARLNRLKSLYGSKNFCPNFLFLKGNNNEGSSLCSMAPLLMQINEEGQVAHLENLSSV